METKEFTVRSSEPSDREWVLAMVRRWGGTEYLISRGRVVHPAELPGLCAIGPDSERLGLAVYECTDRECQLVLLEAVQRFAGIGTALLSALRQALTGEDYRRLWVVTTNDNLDALRFYQRRGFEPVAVHLGLREVAERLKPSLPLVGEFGIPILAEIELEMRFD